MGQSIESNPYYFKILVTIASTSGDSLDYEGGLKLWLL